MTTPFTAKPSLFRRVMDGLRAWEEAMDYDDTLERVKAVENNLAKLREEVRSLKGQSVLGREPINLPDRTARQSPVRSDSGQIRSAAK